MFSNYDFGSKLQDAHLARIEQSEENMEKISEWMNNPNNNPNTI